MGIAPLPVVHGMTTGEIAMWMNARLQHPADLRVIPMEGWQRPMLFHDTGLPWIPTSPGMPHLSTVFAYPCTCLMEGTNLSEGRGTPLPFEVFGAPWLDGYRLANDLNPINLDGVRFRPTRFIPSDSKHAGSVCQGLQMHITDPDAFRPLHGGLAILKILIRTSEDFNFLETSWEGQHPHFDLLVGSSAVRTRLLSGASVDSITAGWEEAHIRFNCERNVFLLYD